MVKFKSLTVVCILGTTFLASCSESNTLSGENRNPNVQTQSSSQNATVQVTGWKPQDACAYLSNVSGLQTRGYKNQFEDTFGCSSPYKELGAGFPLANNIAYYVGGNEQTANELKLVLNVYVSEQAKAAHTVLLNTSQELTQKALGIALPKEVSNAIISGKAGKWTVGKAQAEIKKEVWNTGKGYEVHYIVKKKI